MSGHTALWSNELSNGFRYFTWPATCLMNGHCGREPMRAIATLPTAKTLIHWRWGMLVSPVQKRTWGPLMRKQHPINLHLTPHLLRLTPPPFLYMSPSCLSPSTPPTLGTHPLRRKESAIWRPPSVSAQPRPNTPSTLFAHSWSRNSPPWNSLRSRT